MRSTTSAPLLALAAGLIGAALALSTAAPAASSGRTTTGAVTFTRDVAPILQRACQECHRPGTSAPMPLVTYDNVRPWVRSIKRRVASREMPPWHLDRHVGIQKFKNDRSLSDEEIATIVSWIDDGSPRGNPEDMPPPREFADLDAWQIGTPDLVVSMPVEHVVPAQGPDWFGDFVADTGMTEDRYVRAVETRPSKSGGKAVHHVNTYILQETNQELVGRSDTMAGGEWLDGREPGGNYDVYPEGYGRLLKAGAKFRFDLHYHSTGEELRDRTSIGLLFYPKGYVPKYQVAFEAYFTGIDLKGRGGTNDLDIPPGEANVRHDGYVHLSKPVRIISFMPHMHFRGKAFCWEAIRPDGRVEVLNCTDRYDFNWQIIYRYDDDVAPLLPAGTVIHLTTWHDNSASNRYNPDPRNWIGWGQSTYDEMGAVNLKLVYLTDEQYQEQLAERRAKAGTSSVTAEP